jgi:hypothetical protein
MLAGFCSNIVRFEARRLCDLRNLLKICRKPSGGGLDFSKS